MPPCIQPHAVGPDSILISAMTSGGCTLVQVQRSGDSISATRRWSSTQLKATFNDFVLHDNHIYGFDGTVVCCVDVATGKRQWREGRYGGGQMLLLADQGLLLVISEQGELVLIPATPAGHSELARLPRHHRKSLEPPRHRRPQALRPQPTPRWRLSSWRTSSNARHTSVSALSPPDHRESNLSTRPFQRPPCTMSNNA